MKGENGDTTGIFLITSRFATSMTSTTALKLLAANASFPSFEKITIPGPLVVWIRLISLKVMGSITARWSSPRTTIHASLPSGVKKPS